MHINYPCTFSNKDLLERYRTESMATILMKRRWRWIGHVKKVQSPRLPYKGKAKEEQSKGHAVVDGEEGNEADGKDLEQLSSHGKRPEDVKG